MSFNSIKRSLISIARNIPGKSIGKKVVVIECDDWGGIGMPSKETYLKLLDAGLSINENRYHRNDTLEDIDDLSELFALLRKHKDHKGNSAVMTPFCNVANPNFERISENNFQEYYSETFMETYKRYSRSNQLMDTWQEGIREGVFVPEYHGREHIATAYWLKLLNTDDKKLRAAFDHGFVGQTPPGTPPVVKDFRPNYYVFNEDDIQDVEHSLEEGVDIFNHAFRIPAKVFNAPNGVFIPSLNKSLVKKGIRFNAVPRMRLDRDETGNYVNKTYATGYKTPEGITCYVRNANFEPTDDHYRGLGHVMNQISGAFRCGKAAVIGTHRANFVGGINEANRKKGLEELDLLLTQVLKKWPDVSFMSSRDFAELL